MALTTVEYTYSGQASFAIPFSLGILNRAYVTIQINNQVDGSGDPLYYTNFTWTSDSEVVINGLTNGDIIKIARTIPSNLLLSDYTAGSNITRDNLNIANKQLIMLIHEVLDKNVTQQTKLDTIESGATADQTAAEIKTAYESNANTNAFTDADESKLDGIEAGADVTDTANVTASGALMDSEVSDLAGIKSVNVSTLQVKPAEGAFVDGDKTKLNTIETNADVTDTANVVAALTAGTNITIASDGTIASTAAGGGGGVSDIVEDLTPQLGGDLDLNGQDITGTGNISITGTVNGRTLGTDGTKLDAIEALADVTDTDNVVAALTAGTNVTIAADGTISSTDTNTTYTVGDGGLTTNDFTNADHSKLDGIEASATADQTKADIDALNIDADTLDGQHGSYYTSYADTAVAGIVDSAPGTLDTLNELAQALGDDPNFATTTATNLSLKLPKAGGTMTGDLLFNDGVKAKFGSSNDLQLFHDGSHNWIRDVGTGALFLDTNSAIHLYANGSENMLYAQPNAGVQVFYDNVKKLETTSSGINVTGKIAVGDANTVADHELHIQSSSPTIRLEDTDGNKRFDITQSGNDTNFDFESNVIYKKADGTEVARIDTSGIDVTGALQVEGATGETIRLHRSDTTVTGSNLIGQIAFSHDDDTNSGDGVLIKGIANGATGNATLQIHTGTPGSLTEKVRITDSGIDVTGAIDVANGTTYTTTGDFLAKVQQNSNASGKNGLSVMNAWASNTSTIFEAAMGWNGSASGYYPVFTIDGLGKTTWKDNFGNVRATIDGSGLDVTGSTITTGTSGTTQWQAGSSANKLTIASYDNNIFYHKLSSGNSTSYQVGVEDNIPIYTITNNSIKTTLLGNGNFGVGTSAPTQKLEVAGKIQVTSADPEIFLTDTSTGVDHSIDGNSGVGNLNIHVDKNNEGSDPKFVINVGASSGLFCIEENGDTGIGLNNPANRLHIFDNNSDIDMNSSANGQLHIDGNGYGFGIALNAQAANIYTNVGSRDLVFGVNETEVARVKPAGLDVTGELRTTGSIYLSESGNADSPQVVWSSSGYGDQYIDNFQGNLRVVNSGAQQVTIKQGGNVGIGTTICADKLHVEGNVYLGTSSRSVYTGGGGDLRLQTNTGEVRVLTANGATTNLITSGTGINIPNNLDVGNALNVGGASPAGSGFIESTVVGPSRALQTVGSVNTTQTHIGFENPYGEIGRIDVSAFSVSYVTSSDYRLKTDIKPMQGSIDRVKALKPVNFEWKEEGTRVDGFIAHEAQEVVPEAVSGEKDATKTNKDGVEVPDYQGIDQSKLVPLLTSALQEALAKIDDLELRMANLEN